MLIFFKVLNIYKLSKTLGGLNLKIQMMLITENTIFSTYPRHKASLGLSRFTYDLQHSFTVVPLNKEWFYPHI